MKIRRRGKIRNENEEMGKWKEKQMMWCVNVDEGVWVKDEKEREK